MRLYTLGGSRYGTRCLIQIRAKGLPVEIEVVPTPISPSFAAINPLMLVPALDTGAGILREASVICEYLEDAGSGPALRPDDPLSRARMRWLIRLFEIHYDPWMLRLYATRRGQRPDDEVAQCYAMMKRALDVIADDLDGGSHALGGRLTLADCALMPPFQQAQIFLPDLGLPDPISSHPRIAAYFARTREDPVIAAVLDEMVVSVTGAMARWK